MAAALAISPVAFGYYDFTSWAPMGLGAVILLVMVALAAQPRFTAFGIAAAAGVGLLLALSFASILWADSRDSAWTAGNQLAVYAVVFAVGLLAIRERRDAQAVLVLLGLPALVSSLVLAVIFVGGDGAGALTQGRLNSPIGYVNGAAGLLVMGLWPWLGIAETARSSRIRAVALGAVGLIAAMAVMTQARALVPAFALSVIVVLVAAPGRTRRGMHLLILAVTLALSARWTLAVYSSTGPQQTLTPPASTLRAAGLAVLAAGVVALALKLALDKCAAQLSGDRRTVLSRRTGQGLLALAGIAVLVVAIGAHHRIAVQWSDFTNLNPETGSTNRFLTIGSGYRYDLWRVALDEFTRHPFGGVGAGNYDSLYYLLRHQTETLTVPHSLELQMLAELGVGGAIGLGLLLVAVLWAGLTHRHLMLSSTDIAIRVGALGLFTAWLAATSVDWLYNIPGLAGMAFLAAAILVAPASPSVADRPHPGSVRSAPQARSRQTRLAARASLIAALGVLALLTASLGRQYVAALYGDSGQSLVTKRPVQALDQLRTAEQLDPWSMPTQYAIAAAYAGLDDYAAARTVLLHAQQLEPENYVPPALLGDVATRAGDFGTALVAYHRALRLDPREPLLRQAVASAKKAAR